MANFWDSSIWATFNLVAVLLVSLLAANALKKSISFLQASLIPTSVLGGLMLLVIGGIYQAVTGNVMFDTAFFGGKGSNSLEIITYHALALGFIASTLRTSDNKLTKQRSVEIFNTGVTTVATYLIQAVLGLGITILLAMVVDGFFPAAGVLLPFGFGQGTGQALNYGSIYEADWGFAGGKTFGLSIAALGFLSASIGGVYYLQIMKKRGVYVPQNPEEGSLQSEEVQKNDEIPMNGSIDKTTVQIAVIAVAYLIAYLVMVGLGNLLPGMKSVVYGFNFLFGVLAATGIKGVMQLLHKKGNTRKRYTNNFLLNRIGNFCFDLMIVAGIAAIRLDLLQGYWWILLLLGAVGLVATYAYNRLVAHVLFPTYENEQFMVMYGMLTGTASTGVMLLREVDSQYQTPAADNLVYQNFPAMVFGFPMMLLATLAPKEPGLTFGILVAFMICMNVLLFRKQIFVRKKK